MPILSHVLVVDDDPGMVELISAKIKRAYCCFVNTATTIAEARKLANTKKFDLSIFDFSLGAEQSGIELFAELTKGAPMDNAILITGLEDENIRLQALNAGFRTSVLKSEHFLSDLVSSVGRLGFSPAVENC